MPTVLPSKHDTFVVADAIRQEQSQKVTILGAFPMRDIRVAAGTLFPITLPLGFWFVFGDGEGDFNIAVRLIDPTGTALGPPTSLPPSHKGPDGPFQLVVNVPLITLPLPGKYTVEVTINNKPYRDTFTVGFA
jgi:hypothetical protein